MWHNSSASLEVTIDKTVLQQLPIRLCICYCYSTVLSMVTKYDKV